MDRFQKFFGARTVVVLTAVAVATTTVPSRPATAASTPAGPSVAAAPVASSGVSAPVLGWRIPREPSTVRFNEAVGTHAASTVITLESQGAPSRFAFPLTVPAGDSLQPTPDGGFDIVHGLGNGVGVTTGHLDAPWAHDAVGRRLPTRFTWDGTTLVQEVDTSDASFPVVADPKVTWGWVTGTIYFNKSETANISIYGALPGFFSALVPGWGYALAAYASVLVTGANKARGASQCLKIKLPSLVPQRYSGGYCR